MRDLYGDAVIAHWKYTNLNHSYKIGKTKYSNTTANNSRVHCRECNRI